MLFEVGPSTGGEAITYQEIAAWQGFTGVPLDAWEAETLRSLSGAYLAELHAAEETGRPPPYRAFERVLTREEVSHRVADILGRMEAQDAKLSGRNVAAQPSPMRSAQGSSGLGETPQG